MTVVVKKETKYGVDRFYPVNQMAKNFAILAETKTLTRRALRIIERLGFEIKLEQEELKL